MKVTEEESRGNWWTIHLSLFPPFHVFQSTPVGGPYHIHFLSLKEVTKAVRLEEYQ